MGDCDIFRCQCGCCRLPMRFIVALLLCLAILVCYGHRNVLNVAITEMVIPNNKTTNRACPQYAGDATMTKVEGGKKKWDQNVQAWLLAAFFPGYVLSHIPGGFICDRWGPRWVLLIGITISGLVTFFTPELVLTKDWKIVAGSRCIAGFGQGILYPATASFIQRWIPQSQHGTIGGMVFAANAWGLVVANTLTGTIISHWKSWTVAFSFWGTMSVIWVSFAFLYLFSFPETHGFITEREERFLQDEIGKKIPRPLPICKVLSSCPVWALLSGFTSNNIIIFTMATSFPKYMNNMLNYSIKENAIASSIPFVMMWFGSSLFGLISDILVVKMNANVALVRKSIAVFASVFAFVFIMAATYSNCDRMLAITFFTLAMVTKGTAYASINVNCFDLTINHAGFLTGLCNGLSAITGFLSAKIIGWVVTENTFQQWHEVLWGFNVVSIFFLIFYLIFAKSERAKWDYTPREYQALPPKAKTKWYLQLSPEEFEERGRQQMLAAARRDAGL